MFYSTPIYCFDTILPLCLPVHAFSTIAFGGQVLQLQGVRFIPGLKAQGFLYPLTPTFNKFIGAFGRKVWNNCINTIEQLIQEKETERTYEIIHDAKKHIDEDPHLSNYILRDLNVLKEAGLADLSWSMHKEGCVKEDVEYLISQLEKHLHAENNLTLKL